MNISVIALGKMGLPVAAIWAAKGHQVTGCDINPHLVALTNQGISHITHEPGLAERLPELVRAGRLRATTDTATGVADADLIIVLVPLDVDPVDHRPDFHGMDAAFSAIATGMKPGALVVLETTVPVGTTRGRFLPVLEAGGRRVGVDFYMAFSPERLQSSRIERDLHTYPRVVGGIEPHSGEMAATFYGENFDVPVFNLASAEAAEFCKLAESVYRDVNIALANELALYAGAHGIDFQQIIPAANSQPQSHLHKPGLGVGGHCIPVYPYFMLHDAEGAALTAQARATNDGMQRAGVDRIEESLGGLQDARVLLCGVTYRPGVKEVSHSPMLDMARELRTRGAVVGGHDPLLTTEEIAALGMIPAAPDGSWPADAAVIHTNDPYYRTFDPRAIPGLRVVLDGGAALDPALVADAGATYLGIGRPAVPARTTQEATR